MLKTNQTKQLFWLVYAVTTALQLFAIERNELFGDEAFYWLEGQWLSWSYSEVPGWTPWTLALAEWLFPHHPFFLRLPGLMAALSLPWLARHLADQLGGDDQSGWLAGLLMLSLPLLGVAGTLAIPDIWLVFFTVLAVICLHRAVTHDRRLFYVLLGGVLALGVNVHMRFWVIAGLAGLGFVWQFRDQTHVLRPLLGLSLPLMLVGFLPIWLFNWQHDFPLLTFQLQDRHPWTFQPAHLGFFVVQILLTTPLVFALCVWLLRQPIEHHHKVIKGILFLAVSHWLLYALLGFFSDNLRFNWHWTLVSYVLLLVLAAINGHLSTRFKQAAWITGVFGHWLVMGVLLYWLHGPNPPSAMNTRITNNAVGWQALADKTRSVLTQQGTKQLLTDQFMSLATTAYYAPQLDSVQSLPHPLNRKHGREQQLAIMNRLTTPNDKPQVLLVEHTAMDLRQRIEAYSTWCEQLGGLQWLDQLVVKGGMKTFDYFRTQSGGCERPPVIYVEQHQNVIQGWVLEQKNLPIQSIQLIGPHPAPWTVTTQRVELGGDGLFATLSSDRFQLVQFKMETPQPLMAVQIQVQWQDAIWRSQLHHF